ncbi:site-specific DNA-methyltransferase [Sorangium sp. So ce1335]|uniref:site-specific DNA-methyltransferase n=1 Tax=Sorangium sp. So ce1335 TaxID=3133335 RepID=UPI003F602268
MSDTNKRRVFAALSRADLLLLGRTFKLQISRRMSVEELHNALVKSGRAKVDQILHELPDASLAKIGATLGLPAGAERAAAIVRILEATGEAARPAPAPAADEEQTATSAPVEVPVAEAPAAPAAGRSDLTLAIEVEPRKPRLAWQGMDRRERAVSVPTQVVEVVRPGRAVDRGDSLVNTEARAAAARSESALPPNRLIWTNDNLVALATLLDERDVVTKDYKYRGKVDLVYIDPPFMVNNDFRADNTIDVEIDDEEGVQATKEPSLVEILAYKDTWRQGLDSFLTMLRRRLELLKELLAPTGTIYVHLDWHAVHYVKVMMDELFGYENFLNEIVWKRTSARGDSKGFNLIHDTILSYGSRSAYWHPVNAPFTPEYVRSHYSQIDPKNGKRFTLVSMRSPNPRPNLMYIWKGYKPHANGWAYSPETMAQLDAQGLISYPPGGPGKGQLRLKRYLDEEGLPLSALWADIPAVNSQAVERLGYPTQKPVTLVERIISASCPPGGVVLDCFMGSGTTCEAAERLGRRWIGIDNGKYAIHLARKRLIQLHGQPRPPEKPQADYVECDRCHNVERKERKQRSPGPFAVRPFTVENMGVYQRAEQWQDFQTQRSRYRDEMIKVFGGEPVNHSPLLHGRKGDSWIHVGPLDGPVASGQVWSIAREAQRTDRKAVTVLSADFDTLSGSDKDAVKEHTGVTVTVRAIPASAIEEVKRRIELLRARPDAPIESMAIPAFYAPLSIVLSHEVSGRTARVTLERCEIDIDSFIASQRPILKPVTDGMTPAARKKAKAEQDKWTAREAELQKWLAKATSWQKFVDFWAVDSDYGHRVDADGKPIFENEWQSFRVRRSKGEAEPLVFTAELTYRQPGRYRVAARVTDVFGNDGIAAIDVEVK